MKNLTLLVILVTSICGNSFAQTSGGPDAYGYMWYNSDDPQGPTYSWIDITTSGTQVSGLTDDNSVAFIPMTQPFHYYWSDYSNVKIGSNGWVGFDNISNIAHCFPTIPTAGGSGDNYLAPFMTDLIFNVGSGEVWYYDDVANDRFIISYINAPWWSANVPGYIGSNTFQMILSSADSSITYQYQTLDPVSFNDQAGCAADLEIGIENMTGNIGLEVYNDFVSANNHAVRFEYPDVVTFQVRDPAPRWSQNTGNRGTFELSSQTFSKDVSIENMGNTDVTSDIYVLTELVDLTSTVIWSTTDTISGLTAGQSQAVTYANIGPFAAGQYYFRTTTTNVDDLNPSNNVLSTEIEIVDGSTNPILMTYATQNLPDGSIAWSSGGGAGVYMAPASYPMTIDSVSMYIVDGGLATDYIVQILDDDGPNGSPGTVLSTQTMTGGTYLVNTWVTSILPTTVDISSGGFYIGWIAPTPNSVALGTETAGAISRNTYEYLGTWEEYRVSSGEDFLMNAYLTSSCLNMFSSIDSVSDVSCFGGADGGADITISGAQGSVSYLWDNGGGTSQDLTGMSAGTYNLTYTDSVGCIGTETIVINEPSQLAGSGTSTDEISGNDGSIDLTPSGGTAPYSYSWDNAATTEDISGLTAGSYTCTITDANGCTVDVTVVVGSQVGIEDLTIQKGFNIIPNPNNGHFTIDLLDNNLSIVKVKITNALGQTFLHKSGGNFKTMKIDARFPSGVYFIDLETEIGNSVKRMIVK